jgi:hypothetical protein
MSKFDDLRRAASERTTKREERGRELVTFVERLAHLFAEYLGCPKAQIAYVYPMQAGGMRGPITDCPAEPAIMIEEGSVAGVVLGISLSPQQAADVLFMITLKGDAYNVRFCGMPRGTEGMIGPHEVRPDSREDFQRLFDDVYQYLRGRFES